VPSWTTTTLRGTILDGAQLSDADLRGAYLTGANLSGANLSRANLTNAFLTGVADLSQEQLDQACGSQVKLDPGLKLDRPCPPLGPPGPVPSSQ